MEIAKEYLVDQSGNIKSVLIDIEQYKRIEPIILDYALGEAMAEIEDEEEIELDDAIKLNQYGIMKVKIKKKAIKDINKIPEVYKENIISFIFNDLKKIRNLGEIPDVVKLKGFDNYYRVRIGPYRIGFKYDNNQLIIYRIMDRKDLYKYFP